MSVSKKGERSRKLQCLTFAKAVAEIIRYSIDENFKKRSLKVLKVRSSKEAELKIYRILKAAGEETQDLTFSSSNEEDDNMDYTTCKHSITEPNSVITGNEIRKQYYPASAYRHNWLSNLRKYSNTVNKGCGAEKDYISKLKLKHYIQKTIGEFEEEEAESQPKNNTSVIYPASSNFNLHYTT